MDGRIHLIKSLSFKAEEKPKPDKVWIGNGVVDKFTNDYSTRSAHLEGWHYADKDGGEDRVVLDISGLGKVSHPAGKLRVGDIVLEVLQMYAVPFKGGIEFNLVTTDNKQQARIIVEDKNMSINVYTSRLSDAAFKKMFRKAPKDS